IQRPLARDRRRRAASSVAPVLFKYERSLRPCSACFSHPRASPTPPEEPLMASVQDIKRRIRSVRNTRKITRALELVAAAKLRRAQARIEAMRPYADTMTELIAGVGRAASSVRGLPLLQQREDVAAVAIVPLTGDRGLAGAFNAQILRRAFALERELRGDGKEVRWVAVGKKCRSTLS